VAEKFFSHCLLKSNRLSTVMIISWRRWTTSRGLLEKKHFTIFNWYVVSKDIRLLAVSFLELHHDYFCFLQRQRPCGLRHKISFPARTLESWGPNSVRGMDVYLSFFSLCLWFLVLVAALWRADPACKEAYQLCVSFRLIPRRGRTGLFVKGIRRFIKNELIIMYTSLHISHEGDYIICAAKDQGYDRLMQCVFAK
jgi:hypothetical protein